MKREEALGLAESMIVKASTYESPAYQAGYFEGLVAGWHQCELITTAEMRSLRKRMRENLPPKTPWWDIAARLGL